MNVQLTPESEEILRDKIAAGLEASAVIEEALFLLEDHERLTALRAALKAGEDDIARGDVELFTLELFERLRAEARQMTPEEARSDPDVYP